MLIYYLRLHSNPTVNFLLTAIIGAVAIGLLSPVSIDVSASLPVTLQTYIVILVAFLLGWKAGTLATVLYVIAGAAGIPVFPGYTSGVERLTGLYGGFYFGFIMSALVCGYLAEASTAKTHLRNLMIWILGHLVVLLLGFAWQWQIVPPESGWIAELKPLLPGMMIKVALGILTVYAVGRLLQNSRQKKEADNQ